MSGLIEDNIEHDKPDCCTLKNHVLILCPNTLKRRK